MCNSDFSRMGMLPEGVSPDSPTDTIVDWSGGWSGFSEAGRSFSFFVPTDQDAYNPYAPCPDCGKSFMSHDNPAKCDKL